MLRIFYIFEKSSKFVRANIDHWVLNYILIVKFSKVNILTARIAKVMGWHL